MVVGKAKRVFAIKPKLEKNLVQASLSAVLDADNTAISMARAKTGLYQLVINQNKTKKRVYVSNHIVDDIFLLTNDSNLAAQFELVEVEQGYHLKTEDKFIEIVFINEKAQPVLVDTPTGVWEIEKALDILTFSVDGQKYYLGSTKKFEVMSAGEIVYSDEFARKKYRKEYIKQNVLGFSMACPPFFAFIIFSIIPMGMSLYMSFMNLNTIMLDTATFAGFSNYVRVLKDPLTYQALGNTATYCLHVVFDLIMAVFLANMLAKKRIFGKKAVRILYFLPAVCPAVASVVMWSWIFNEDYGLLNEILTFFGLGLFRPYTNANHMLPAVLLVRLWIGGTNIVLLQSAFANLNRNLEEAARIDGATERQVFWKINLPQVAPTIFYLLVMNFVAAAQEMGTLQVFAKGTIGPGGKALTIGYYLQRMIGIELLTKGYGMSCALSWLYSIVLITFTRIMFRVGDKVISYD